MARTVKARPLLLYVLALAAVMTAPPLLLAGMATARFVSSEQGRLQTLMRETTDHAVAHTDQFLVGKIAMLQALATSPALDGQDFRQLDQQARELLNLQGMNIVLRDLAGQQLVNTRVPFGTPLPRVPNYDADFHVARTKAPYVTDLYLGVMARGPLIRVIVPVIRGGVVTHTLTASLAPTSLARLLEEAGLTDPYRGAIADRSGTVIGRVAHDQGLIGKPLPNYAAFPDRQGTWSGSNSEDVQVVVAYKRSPLSGWLFTAALDRTILDDPLHRSLGGLALLAVSLGVLAFAASSFIARRVIGAQRQVAATAATLAEGGVASPPNTHLTETNVIGRVLSHASVRLRDQADALVAVNRDLERLVVDRTREVSTQADLIRATLDNMDQGLMFLAVDGTVPICNPRARELLDLPAELMDQKPTFEAVRQYQLDQGEFARSDTQLQAWVANSGIERTQHSYERERPNGMVIEIRTVPLATGGAVRTYTDVTARKQAERASHHMARHDALTDLPNRVLFQERLRQELAAVGRRGGSFAVLCLDLDRFKAVNDTLGHLAGDALLRQVADRIRATAREEDSIARLGGDEFAIIQPAGAQPTAANALARRVIEAMRAPFDLDGRIVSIGVSVGVAVAPGDGAEADAIFKSADLALYRAKSEGRNTCRFYEAAMDVAVQERQTLELDLSQALARDEFELFYQPVVDAATGEPSAFEALLRWRHPVRGMISPAEFVPLAEESRRIVPIGAWVIQEACREAATWPDAIGVSVNISPTQIDGAGLVATVLAALMRSGLAAGRLQLEITETVLMDESETVLGALHALREHGVRIALDDFGTGHSSLKYLQQFPLDRIKIDRSFVQGIENETTAAIFEAIVGLATRLGVAVTVEGVETEAELAHVRRAGCAEVQGYLFSRPVPAAQARGLMAGPRRVEAA